MALAMFEAVKLFLVLTLLCAGCEIAFPITLDAADPDDADCGDAHSEADRFDQDRREK